MEYVQKLECDKKRIVDYMRNNHEGFAKRTVHMNIVRALSMNDRYFRDLVSDIPEIITSSSHGYYILPQEDAAGEECRIAENIILEHRKRAIALFLRAKKQKRAIADMANKNQQLILF